MPKRNISFAVFNQAGGPSRIYIYDVIDTFWGVKPEAVTKALAEIAGPVEIWINSPGGTVTDGMAIAAAIKSRGGCTAVITGLAASMASVIAAACDAVRIHEGAFFMVHNPWTAMAGDSEELRKQADLMDEMRGLIVGYYQRHTDQTAEQLTAAMDAETWVSGAKAAESGWKFEMIPTVGLADGVGQQAAAAAALEMPLPAASAMARASQALAADLASRADSAALAAAAIAERDAARAELAAAKSAAATLEQAAGALTASAHAREAGVAAERDAARAEAQSARAALARLTGGLAVATPPTGVETYADWASEQFRQLASR